MDLTQLTHDLVSVLIPALPFLTGVGQGAAGRVVGEAVLVTTKKIWVKLRPNVESRPAANEAAQELATHPDDEDAQAALRFQLKKLLADDTDLANELSAIMAEAQPTYGERSAVIHGDMNDGVIVVGDKNTVQHGKYNIKIDKASGLAIGDNSQVTTSGIDEDKE